MPVGFRIASAWVDIRAEDKGLRQQIKDAVEKAAKGQDAKIPLKIDSKGLRREVENALKEATKGQKPSVAISIKSAGLRKEVSDALKKATEKQKPTVKLSINSAGLRTEVQRALTAATKDQKPTVRLGISSVGLRAEVQRALNEATRGQEGHVRITADLDTDRIRRALADTHPTIRPDVDVQHMRQALLSAIRRVNVNNAVTINPNIDGDAMANQIRSEVARLRDKFRVRIDPDVDTDTFAARIRAAARMVPSNIDIDLNPRINQLRLRAEAAAAAARVRANITFTGTLNTAMTRARLMASLRLAQAGAHITVPVRTDFRELMAAIGGIESSLRAIEGPTGRWAKIIQAGALAALPAMGQLDHAIRSTSASIAVAIPMVTMLTAAFAAAKIGMEGMGTVISGIFNEETLTNHQLDVLDATLDNLAPNALRFANALKNVKGEFTFFRQGIQQILFTNLDSSLNQFTKQTLPDMKLGLAGTADQLNRMTVQMINVVNTSARTGELKLAFGAIQSAMEPLVPLPGRIYNALSKMTIAAAPLLIRMTKSFDGWSKGMTEKLNKAFANGTLQAAISKAGDTIVGFFRRVANNPEFRQFLDRMKENGPTISKAFGEIATALMKVLNALSPISGIVLKVVEAFAQFINALPTIFLDAFIIKLVIFKAALGVSALVKNLVTALLGLKAAIIALASTDNLMLLFATRLERMGVAYGAIMRLSAAMGFLTKAGLALGGLAFTFGTIQWALEKLIGDGRLHADIDKMAESLNHFKVSGSASGEMARVYGKDFGKLGDAIKEIAHPGMFDRISHGFQRLGEAIAINGDHWTQVRDTVKAADKQLADLVKNGDMQTAALLYRKMSLAALDNGTSIEKFNTLLPEYQGALKAAREAQEVAAETMGVFGKQALTVSGRLQQLKKDTDGLTQSLFAMNNTQRDSNQATRDMEEAATAMVEATKKKGIGLDYVNGQLIQQTKAQREAASAIEDYAAKTEKSALATYQATGNWEQAAKTLEDGRAAIIRQAKAAGMGEEAANNYANAIFRIPSKKEVNLMIVDQATMQLQDVAAAFRAVPGKKEINVTTLNSAAIKALQDLGMKVEQLPDGSFKVTAKTAPAVADLQKIERYKIDPKTVDVIARIAAYTRDIDAAQAKVDGLKQKRATAVGADKTKLDREIAKAQKELDALKQKRAADILALDKTGPAVKSAKDNLNSVKDKQVTITVLTHLASDPAASAADAIRKQADRFSGKRFGGVIRRASGGGVPGMVTGPGGPTSDIIPALLSNGEFVMRAAAVKKYGLSFLSMLNSGRFPKFAQGGAVSGSAAPAVKSGTTTGTFTVTDETGKPVASAVKNFQALKTALSQTYVDMQQKSSLFGTQFAMKSTATFNAVENAGKNFSRAQSSSLAQTSNQSQNIWNTWRSGMTARTSDTYKNLTSASSQFQKNHTGVTSRTSTSTQNIWAGWKSGMVKQTTATYSTLNSATSNFSKQSISKIGGARDGMGSAWGGLGPRFKPPISYLVHTVLNTGLVGSMNAMMSKLGGGKTIGGVSVPGFAEGGPIHGPGTGTSDSIPARLSAGEFVIRAKAVNKFGAGFFDMLNRGVMPHDGAGFRPGFAKGGLIGFASGGSVPSSDELNKILGDGGDAGAKRMTQFIMDRYVMPLIDSGTEGSAMRTVQKQAMTHIQANVEKFVKENFGGAGSAAAGLRWAKTQYGKPYQWGGNGNPSWDCSGFMSAIESVIRGEKPHRRWATGAFSGATAPPGWKLGAKAPFQIGITNAGVGHTAGTIGKENVESSGGIGVHGGVGVPRGAHDSMFDAVYGYVGPNATKKAVGGLIRGRGTGTSDSIPAWLSNGEYVIRAAAARRLGTGFLNALNAGRVPGFAAGGSVSTSGGSTYYKVKYGDTLSEIAARFHTTVGALMSLNKTIKDANKIYAGQTLLLKKATSGSNGGNQGTSGSTGSAGKFTLPTTPKAPKGDIQDSSALGGLKGFVTIGKTSQDINAAGGHIQDEFMSAFLRAGSTTQMVENLKDLTNQISNAFKGKTESILLSDVSKFTKAMVPLQTNLDGVNKKLEDAQDALQDVKQKFDQLKESVASNIMDYGKVTKIGQYGTSPTTLLNQLQKDVGNADKFKDMLNQLKAKGVNSDIIGQIAEAGISGGGMATAQTILQMTPEQLKQLDDLQKHLTDTANKAGDAAAHGMYDAGIKAAEGLVKGLQDQQKAIEAQMLQIATAMEKAIKQALGIKSPSRVMMKVADYTADGLQNQLIVRRAGIAETMKDLVTVPKPDVARTANPISGTARIATGSHDGDCIHIENINVTVTGTFDLTNAGQRRSIAQALVKEIKEEIRRDDKKRR